MVASDAVKRRRKATETSEMSRNRLLEVGATEDMVDSAHELGPDVLNALVELDDIAASYEDSGSELPELCKTPECRDEIVRRLRTVIKACSTEQEVILRSRGDTHVAETMPVTQGGRQVQQETGLPRRVDRGESPPKLVSDLWLLIRSRHASVFDGWFGSWKRDILAKG